MRFQRPFSSLGVPRLIAGAVMLAAASLSGCRDLQGDKLALTGAVEILVQDQAGTPIFDVTVSLFRVSDVLTHRTANTGVVRFDLAEEGERSYFVTNPAGYSGGGQENTKTVTIVAGQVSRTTFTLTKIPATPGAVTARRLPPGV